MEGVCDITRDRIRIALWAYAYECKASSLASDGAYDSLSLKVHAELNRPTSRPDMDAWFKENFDYSTGSWIYDHPEFDKIAELWANSFEGKKWKPFTRLQKGYLR